MRWTKRRNVSSNSKALFVASSDLGGHQQIISIVTASRAQPRQGPALNDFSLAWSSSWSPVGIRLWIVVKSLLLCVWGRRVFWPVKQKKHSQSRCSKSGLDHLLVLVCCQSKMRERQREIKCIRRKCLLNILLWLCILGMTSQLRISEFKSTW